MESYEIVAAALQARLPVAVIRVVSDSLDRQIPDFNLALEDNGEINSLKLAESGPRLSHSHGKGVHGIETSSSKVKQRS